MTPTRTSAALLRGSAVCCDVAAAGTVRGAADALNAMRPALRPPRGDPLPASVLKHIDEQTVAALAAVYRAMTHHGLAEIPFTAWGVLAAPRFLGRAALAETLDRFAAEGAWGVSPHVIPHRTLHAVSGTLSLALGIHGPNFGVDAAPGTASQVLLAALAVVTGRQLPGVWLALTGWDPEPLPPRSRIPHLEAATSLDGNGHVPAPICSAVALALVPARPEWQGLRLRLLPAAAASGHAKRNGHAGPQKPFRLEDLLATLEAASRWPEPSSAHPPAAAAWRMDGDGWLELSQAADGSTVGGGSAELSQAPATGGARRWRLSRPEPGAGHRGGQQP